ncbi:peptide ABC transporter substrate-binding protein [Spelaeicoccus albus]|uniref:Peptide/nickel transport system substrate-binding protein/oligopeptide transport system substrate-binding protein n=1 Tax=Spelaeicoccus albus TaxID=1280376 RepID=A0A7Z0D4S5_9MICO|nr:ABC transporter substrate-binding protein [Spelaeicoccus albus]NYI68879.1 peptide/nickel transport system substrate-binding protein/oligopeptide transport system substrate-binding protein [Spelaeicoccus albus]
MFKNRAVLAAAAAASLLLGAAACSDGGGQAGSDGGDGTLTFETTEPKSLLPQKDPGSQIAMATCANLMEMNTKTQKYEPLAAKSVKSTDAKSWTIKLRHGWTFQDGSPVTASSFVQAWNKAAYGPNAWQGNGMFASFKGYDAMNPPDGSKPKVKKLSGVQTSGKYTITVTLSEPNSDFPKILSTNPTCPLPKVAFTDPKSYESKPISNGPYKVVSWDHNQSVTMKKWDGFKGSAGFSGGATTLVAKIYTSPDAAYTDMTANNLDMMRNIQPAMVAKAKSQLGSDALYKVKTESKQNTLQFPEYLKKLRSPELRHAIAMSIDRKSIAKSLLQGNSAPSDSLVPPSLGSYRKGSCEACTYNPTKAKKLLKKSGGFSGTLNIDYNSDSDKELVQAVSKQIKSNLGIKVQLKPMLGTELQSKRNNGKLDGALFGLWGWSFKSPDQYLSQYETNGDGNAATGYSNPAVDKLIRSARGELNVKKRNAKFAKAEHLILQDMPAIPLFVPKDYGLHSKCAVMNDVQGDLQFYRAGYGC